MAKLVRVLFCIFMGYYLGALVSGVLVNLFSGNVHDKSLEAAMTAGLIGGPVGALLGLVAGLLWKVPKQPG